MIQQMLTFINLHDGEEHKEKVLAHVRLGVSFRGANLWILACAIVVASVGLNVNSTAVIIGAMLISPLMGPIVGAGFALGTADLSLLKRSGKNLVLATVVSLVVAFLYFTVSPFKETQSELLARTSPNIYDVLIAFFGGLVGVISITRVEKGNPIPGVAIATALMPPLCTAGYGLAIGNYSFFMGAFYLYSINCFFIFMATYLLVKYLRYPLQASIDPKWKQRIRLGITSLMVVLLVPSFYLAYGLYLEKRFSHRVDRFIRQELVEKGQTLLYQNVDASQRPRKIELVVLSHTFSAEELAALNRRLADYGIEDTELRVRQDLKDLKKEILKEVHQDKAALSEKSEELDALKSELSAFKVGDAGLVQEMRILHPQIEAVSLGRHQLFTQDDRPETRLVCLVRVPKTDPLSEADAGKLRDWLEVRLREKVELVQN